MRSHKQSKTYTCEECSKVFHRLDSYKVHIQTHDTSTCYKCEICSRQFQHKSSYNRHMNNHSTPKQYTCDECGKSFDRNDILMVHLKMHQITEKIKKKKKATSTLTDLNRLDPSKLLDCSVSISSEHRYSMKTIDKSYGQITSSKTRSSNHNSKKHNLLELSVKDLPSFSLSNKLSDTASESSLDNLDSLNTSDSFSTSDPLSINSISPVPILMSMAESAANFLKAESAANNSNRPSLKMKINTANFKSSTNIKKTKGKGKKSRKRKFTDDHDDLSLFASDETFPSNSRLSEGFIPLLPESHTDIILSSTETMSDSESVISSDSDTLCIDVGSDKEESSSDT